MCSTWPRHSYILARTPRSISLSSARGGNFVVLAAGLRIVSRLSPTPLSTPVSVSENFPLGVMLSVLVAFRCQFYGQHFLSYSTPTPTVQAPSSCLLSPDSCFCFLVHISLIFYARRYVSTFAIAYFSATTKLELLVISGKDCGQEE